jgi:[glutamine synthetase] adenylyltransferase / [glutamine synthetase]-adenylyl-L-tyrosine phosphorylase
MRPHSARPTRNLADTESHVGLDLQRAADTALQCSRFAARSLTAELGAGADAGEQHRWLVANASHPWDRARIEAALAADRAAHPDLEPTAWLPAAMRRLRRRLLLGVMVRDVARSADLTEVTGSMTALAECCVQQALRILAADLAARHGTPSDASGTAQDLLVVAMGKGGAGELNVSSDLDLVFVYDATGHTQAAAGAPPLARSMGNQEFFERLGRLLIAALSEPSSDGFVFRADMRLRPNGDSGPLVVSCAMLEEYLTRQGREWERFAWLKGRVISAPVLADRASFTRQSASLQAVVQPFVFRRYLDFNAIGALRELHAKIRRQAERLASSRGRSGDHVKLGRGGIREIEFIVQTFQVMRGGRDDRLRSRPTLATLATLGELGLLSVEHSRALADAYEFLRRLEHALQYIDDAQTHLIPPAGEQRDRVAQLLGFGDAEELMARYREHAAPVAAVFDRIFAAPVRAGSEHGSGDLTSALAALGFPDPAAMAQRVGALLESPRVTSTSEANRMRMAHLVRGALPAIVEEARRVRPRAGAPVEEIFKRWLQLLEVIGGRSTYIALLDEYAHAVTRVVRLLAAGHWAAEYLARHPVVLDELLDDRVAAQPPEPDFVRRWSAQVRRQLDADTDSERAMNLLRDAHHAHVFRVLIADVNGALSVESVADHLSALADAALDLSLATVWRMQRGPQAAPPWLAVVAYGKLGGKELGYASDLDLIFVYDDPDPDAPTVYAQLVRRLVTWLSSPTSSGVLFDVDLRLRPNGNAGLLVTSLEAFTRYQLNEDGHGAWAWEHQALTRARACAGDPQVGGRIEQLRRRVLAQPRDRSQLAAEVLAMRERMLQGHPNASGLFDLKHDRGGMVDIEFVVQFLVLAESARHPELLDNLGNIALLKIAAGLALIEPQLALAAADVYRQYRSIQHVMRLDGAAFARVPPTQVAESVEVVGRLWQAVFGPHVSPLPPCQP